MSNVTITIDGKVCQAQEGEFILNVARANDIFIPAICYLTRCSPTLACRICLVEADGKQVYACNAKAKEGMNITTTTPNIAQERRAIMEVYDVNHPLECGVCDQSGECELQNYTLEEKVDSQSYYIADSHKLTQDWGLLKYDPALCIVCERCTTTCKDMIGDAAISTVARGTEGIDAALKESMPKDAYAMWNKLNKSLIGPSNGETLDCTNCGECIAVCPVGAIVSSDFQYKSNAWELTQVPATCAHCSAGCHIKYEKKHTSIANPDERLYRVTNEWNYQTLCGAGRFGYDFENRVASKDEAAFSRAVQALKQAQAIAFSSEITNEEAYMLSRLKEVLGVKLYNPQAYAFNAFLTSYAEVTGEKLPKSDLKKVHASDFVISVGSALKTDNPAARFAMNNALTMNKGAGIYFHPVEDSVIAGMSKNMMTVQHKAGLEEAVLYLLLDLFADKSKLPQSVVTYLESFHAKKTITVEETIKEKVVEKVLVKKLNEETGIEEEIEEEKTTMVPKTITKEVEVDENALLAMVNASESFNADLEKALAKKEAFALIVGEDCYGHPNSANIAKLVGLVATCSDFEVVIVPPQTNALGVSLICDLDSQPNGYTVGYNVKGDFTLSALGGGDLDMPALNQQEGTFTTINKQVVPTNAALGYNGYVLKDLYCAVTGETLANTIDCTPLLASKAGYQAIAFDDLPNYFSNDGVEHRGYALTKVSVTAKEVVCTPIAQGMDGSVIYHANPVLQFNDFTAKSTQLQAQGGVYVSKAFAQDLGLATGDNVRVKTQEAQLVLPVTIDSKVDGSIALVSRFDTSKDTDTLFNGYRFNQATISKV